jgi:hypothetical protein
VFAIVGLLSNCDIVSLQLIILSLPEKGFLLPCHVTKLIETSDFCCVCGYLCDGSCHVMQVLFCSVEGRISKKSCLDETSPV